MSDLVRLEGLHALKHAVRFGATVTEILTDDLERALAIADQVAPDVRPLLEQRATIVSTKRFREAVAQPVPTHTLAFAERPQWTLQQTLPTPDHPTILLDDPRNSKNLGAVIRVGAAAGAAGLLVNGSADFCDPMAVRGAAGLQWALPSWGSPEVLAHLDDIRGLSRPSPTPSADQVRSTFDQSRDHSNDCLDDELPSATVAGNPGHVTDPLRLIGFDADGVPFDPGRTGRFVFAFGSERTGLSESVRTRCEAICSLPMRPHVSSLNLACSVSAVLYSRLYACASART
jgi:TrmH family RNA methyltransferase